MMFLVRNFVKPLLVLNMIFLIEAQRFSDGDDLSTLGARINAQVQRDLAPLQGLGARINAQVENRLRHVQNDLSTLGERIALQVEEGLKPVRALELQRRMMEGVGGLTIVTHLPAGVRFIVKNSKIYKCTGEINLNTGSCSGNVEPFVITSSSPKTDWCFIRAYNQVNDNICLSTNGVIVSVINNVFECNGVSNSEVFILKLDAYKNLCSPVSEKVEYRYFSDVRSDSHVPIPNPNPYVKCKNNDNNFCIFQKTNPLLSIYNFGQSSIGVNNYYNY